MESQPSFFKFIEHFKQEKFCCCCNLKIGSYVISTLGWLLSFCLLIYMTSPLNQEDNPYRDFTTAEIFYGVTSLVVCVMMIVGVYKNNEKFIRPWLSFKYIECFSWTVIIFIQCILLFFVGDILKLLFSIFIIFFITRVAQFSLVRALNWYFWVCVWSFYVGLENKTDVQEIHIEDIQR